jgi:hypothetical protein
MVDSRDSRTAGTAEPGGCTRAGRGTHQLGARGGGGRQPRQLRLGDLRGGWGGGISGGSERCESYRVGPKVAIWPKILTPHLYFKTASSGPNFWANPVIFKLEGGAVITGCGRTARALLGGGGGPAARAKM